MCCEEADESYEDEKGVEAEDEWEDFAGGESIGLVSGLAVPFCGVPDSALLTRFPSGQKKTARARIARLVTRDRTAVAMDSLVGTRKRVRGRKPRSCLSWGSLDGRLTVSVKEPVS